jgi:hypothetical protein
MAYKNNAYEPLYSLIKKSTSKAALKHHRPPKRG